MVLPPSGAGGVREPLAGLVDALVLGGRAVVVVAVDGDHAVCWSVVVAGHGRGGDPGREVEGDEDLADAVSASLVVGPAIVAFLVAGVAVVGWLASRGAAAAAQAATPRGETQDHDSWRGRLPYSPTLAGGLPAAGEPVGASWTSCRIGREVSGCCPGKGEGALFGPKNRCFQADDAMAGSLDYLLTVDLRRSPQVAPGRE
ncbi:hypothetical protein VTK26DRAFT_3548 [Humicola hyalothermophila]